MRQTGTRSADPAVIRFPPRAPRLPAVW